MLGMQRDSLQDRVGSEGTGDWVGFTGSGVAVILAHV